MMIALLILALKYQIPILLLFAGLISINIAIELHVAEGGALVVTLFAVMGLYFGLMTIRGVRG
jgi:hypothetical protein